MLKRFIRRLLRKRQQDQDRKYYPKVPETKAKIIFPRTKR